MVVCLVVFGLSGVLNMVMSCVVVGFDVIGLVVYDS